MKIPSGFASTRQRAEAYARDLQKSAHLIEQAYHKAAGQEKRIKHIGQELGLLLKMAKAWTSGQYRDIPAKTVIAVLAALLYFVNPFDVVPDAILGFGYIDDLTVISFVINTIRKDLEKFKKWSEKVDKPETLKEGDWRELNE